MNATGFPWPWPRAYPRLAGVARFKSHPEDFQVDEVLAFVPQGVGEHLYLRVEKRAMETRRVAEDLARQYAVAPIDVGYAGMKDKRAVSRQWFSVRTPLSGRPNCSERYRVLEISRHPRKLKRGQIVGNRFVVLLRDVDATGWQQRLDLVAAGGVPNYFGPQRFGFDNLACALDWLPQRRRCSIARFKQGLYLSVLRSYLFNEILARRVQDGTWQVLLPGDVAEDSVPTAPLWGRGRSATTAAARGIEMSVLAPHTELCDGLEHAGVRQQRRRLALHPQNLKWEVSAGDLQLKFQLEPGCYATSLLAEVFTLSQPEKITAHAVASAPISAIGGRL